jgi:hypothetical protein
VYGGVALLYIIYLLGGLLLGPDYAFVGYP